MTKWIRTMSTAEIRINTATATPRTLKSSMTTMRETLTSWITEMSQVSSQSSSHHESSKCQVQRSHSTEPLRCLVGLDSHEILPLLFNCTSTYVAHLSIPSCFPSSRINTPMMQRRLFFPFFSLPPSTWHVSTGLPIRCLKYKAEKYTVKALSNNSVLHQVYTSLVTMQ